MKKLLLLFLFLPFFSFAQPLDTAQIRVEVDRLFEMIDLEIDARNNDQADRLLNQVDKLIQAGFGIESLIYSSWLNRKGKVSYYQGKYQEVEQLWIKSLAIREKVLGKEHPLFAENLTYLAKFYSYMGDFKQSEPMFLESLAIQEKTLGKEHPEYVLSLSGLGRLYSFMGEYEKVEPIYLEVLAIREKDPGKNHPDYAVSLISLGALYGNMGEYKKAEPFYLEAIAIREKVLGKDHPDYANTVNNLGTLYRKMGEYEKAEPLHLEAMAIREKVLGKDHPEYASTLNSLGTLYEDMGDYGKAEPLLLESLAIREKVYGKEHPNHAVSLTNLGILYQNMGAYEKAEPLYLESLKLDQKVFGEEHPNYSGSLNNLGALYWEMGAYEKAEPLLLEALSIDKTVLGKEHPDYALGLNNLGLLYRKMGNYEKAEPHYLEALAIYEKVLGKEHPEYANSLDYLGGLYQALGVYKKAELRFIQALKIREKVFGKDHPDYAQNLDHLGLVYWEMENYEKAEPYFLQALSIYEDNLGKEHPHYASSLNNLGNLYGALGAYEKADVLLQEALVIIEKILGENHLDYAFCLDNLGAIYWEMGDFEKAKPLFLNSNEVYKTRIIMASHYLSETELLAYVRMIIQMQNLFSSFAQDIGGINQHIYNNAIFQKGFVLNVTKGNSRLAQTDSISQALLLRQKSLLRRLAVEYSKPISEYQMVEELEAEANQLEKELVRTVAGYGKAFQQVEWSEIQEKLAHDEAAIEFVQYNFADPNPTDSTFYAALVLRPGDKEPLFIQLFEEKALMEILAKNESLQAEEFVAQLYSQGFTSEKKIMTSKLYELVWEPINGLLKDTKTVYLSPSGLLHRINLGGIPIDSTRTLTDRYNLVTLGSTRQLVINRSDDENKRQLENLTATFYGGILYDVDSTKLKPVFQEVAVHTTSEEQLAFSYLGRSATERGRSWDYLPATKKEVDIIGKIIQAKGGEAQIFQDITATEESFKQLGQKSPSPRILHLATHGYFYPDPEETVGSMQSAVGSLGSSPAFKVSDHPMIRSGLILAGGNHAWRTGKPLRPDMEDGILTAYEISQMNLDSTELVVLSACETGLGDIEGNEGVYGLQRAFKIAGVKNIIMSLWSVPDEQTQEMMVAFYEYWLNEGMELADAFRAAQREMREKYEDHYFWAGFVLIE